MRLSGFALFIASCVPVLFADDARTEEFFEMQVRPVLAKNCLGCHGASKMGGLAMVSRDSLMKGGASGPAISANSPEHSLMLKVLRHEHERIKMPPQGKLPDSDIALIEAWLKAGAVWPARATVSQGSKSGRYVISPEQRAFWSFQPVRKQAPPAIKNAAWAQSNIDRFILAKLEAKGIEPAKAAGRRTLIRRATFDLTGLPPKPEDVDAFLRDRSPDAFAKVVDRLLASPQYGERWGRQWLDVARYADDKLQAIGETPQPNAFRYRNWVIDAFNQDMPYNLFVKAQIAGDLLPDAEKTRAGLGLYALSPELQDDRVDVTTRGFLGLTVACAQCHDHKYDPIPTTDYYAVLGIFNNTKLHEQPIAPKDIVENYDNRQKEIDAQEARLKEFLTKQGFTLGEIFAGQTARYLPAAFSVVAGGKQTGAAAQEASLDERILGRWVEYLTKGTKDHPFLKQWDALVADARPYSEKQSSVPSIAEALQRELLAVIQEKKKVDERNLIVGGGQTERFARFLIHFDALPRDRHMLYYEIMDIWRGKQGVLYFDEASLDRYLTGEWKHFLAATKADIAARKKALPEKYPFLYSIKDADKLEVQRVHIRGDKTNLGDAVPPRSLSILVNGEPQTFKNGSGRLELAEAIVKADNPLTARVMANRIWLGHFGEGIVRTPSNFGQLGQRPTHPELLDYLAARFVEQGWSMKAMHREIMLSATYAMSADRSTKAEAIDPENTLFWRANVRRLDAESLRDALLFASGKLDLTPGGPGERFDVKNNKRTVYGYVSRKRLDPVLALFDFPNPNTSSEQRVPTTVPLQGLFFLNSEIMAAQAEHLASKYAESDRKTGITSLYRTLFGREPSAEELKLGLKFLSEPRRNAWEQYISTLLSSQEFVFIA